MAQMAMDCSTAGVRSTPNAVNTCTDDGDNTRHSSLASIHDRVKDADGKEDNGGNDTTDTDNDNDDDASILFVDSSMALDDDVDEATRVVEGTAFAGSGCDHISGDRDQCRIAIFGLLNCDDDGDEDDAAAGVMIWYRCGATITCGCS